MRVMDQVVDIAVAAARTRAPALEKLNRLVTAIHRHNKTKLIQDRIQRGEDTDAGLREQIRFIGKALGKSAARPTNVRSGSTCEELTSGKCRPHCLR